MKKRGIKPRFLLLKKLLDAERRSATAGALHVRVLELEARALQGLDVIHLAAIQVHGRGRVNKNFYAFEVEGLVHHAGIVLERHGIGEAGASAADYADAQASRDGALLRHDLL